MTRASNDTTAKTTPTIASTGSDNRTKHPSPFRRRRFKQRRESRKGRRRGAKAVSNVASRQTNTVSAPTNIIDLTKNSKKSVSSAVIETEKQKIEAAQAEIDLARKAVAKRLLQQKIESEKQEGEKEKRQEEPADTGPLPHKNKYSHIAQVEPQARSLCDVGRTGEAAEDVSVQDTMSGCLSGSVSFSESDDDSTTSESDSELDSESDSELDSDFSCEDNKEAKYGLDRPKNADTLFELESKPSGSTCSSSSFSSSSSMMSSDGGSSHSSGEESSLAQEDEEDSLVNTIVGFDQNDDDTLVDTIVGGDDTVCNADDTKLGDGNTVDANSITDSGEDEGNTDEEESDDDFDVDHDESSVEAGEEMDTFFASFCQRPKDNSFDLLEEGNYNPLKDGRKKSKQDCAKKDSVLTVSEVPSLLKCVSGYFVGDATEERVLRKKKSYRSTRHRSRSRRYSRQLLKGV